MTVVPGIVGLRLNYNMDEAKHILGNYPDIRSVSALKFLSITFDSNEISPLRIA